MPIASSHLRHGHCYMRWCPVCSTHIILLSSLCLLVRRPQPTPHGRSIGSTPLTSVMAGSKRNVAAALVLSMGLVVVMAMVADASGVCDPDALYPCLPAIQGAHPPAPSRQCCRVVQTVDKTCMCKQLKSSSFPAKMVHNGLQLPNKCGRTDLRGFRCGRYTFPY